MGAQCLDTNAFPSSGPLLPVKGLSIIEEMAKAVYRRRLVHFSRGWGERERGERFDENACINRSASLNRFGFSSTTINFT